MRGIVLLVSLLFVLTEPAFAQARFPFTAETVSDRVHVRAGQNNNFESVAQLAKGAPLTVLDKKFKWFKVALPAGAKAFVKSSYINLLSADLGEVKVDRLNVRAAPNTEATTVGQLKQGQRFFIAQNAGEWIWIRPVDGVYGWVNESLLVFKSNGARSGDPDPNAAGAVKAAETRVEQARQAARTSLLRKNADGSVECSGKLLKAEQGPAAYKVQSGSAVACYVDGAAAVMDGFIGSDIRLQGKVKSIPADADAAVLSLMKISLAL
ncbi:MAG: SH3 domain-containing protein [Candidatus Omnitrophota bacterium]